MTTDTNLLLRWIAENNFNGIWGRLIHERKVSVGASPDYRVFVSIVEEQAQRMPLPDYLNWLETLLDVPIVRGSVYATELDAVRTGTGKSPAKHLTDTIRATLPPEQQPTATETLLAQTRGSQIFTLVFWGLALVGAFVVLRWLGRRFLGMD